jgi:tryptophan-rich sensory protein
MKGRAITNIVLLLLTLVVNSLGAIGRVNGFSQKAVSDRYLTIITPAPFTFGIWSVIYSLLILSLIMMATKNDRYYQNAVQRISGLFWLSCVLNAAWIVAFSYLQIGLAALIIFLFVVILALILQRLREIQDGTHFLLPLTFGVYTGWLIIATVVNISSWLVSLKWGGFGIASQSWGVIILCAGMLITALVMSQNRNAALSLPLAWAYYGIYRSLIAPDGLKGQYPTLQLVCIAGIVVYVLMFLVRFYRNGFMIVQEARR